MTRKAARGSTRRKPTGPPKPLRDYLTVSQAAAFLGISPATLRNWDRSGKLRADRHAVNDFRLYRRDELKRVLSRLIRPAQRQSPRQGRPQAIHVRSVKRKGRNNRS